MIYLSCVNHVIDPRNKATTMRGVTSRVNWAEDVLVNLIAPIAYPCGIQPL